MNILSADNVIRTSYGSGPYVVTAVSAQCTCPPYQHTEPSAPHYHLTCRLRDRPRKGEFCLNGYRPDGSNVWSSDRIELADGYVRQLELFGAQA